MGKQLYPELPITIHVPSILFQIVFLFSLFLSVLPWIWAIFFTARSEKKPTNAYALSSVLSDKKLYFFSIGITISALVGFVLFSIKLLPPMINFAIGLVLIGFIVDNIRWSFFRMQFRRSAEGLADWLLHRLHLLSRRRDLHALQDVLETIFSLLIGYITINDVSALRVFTHKITTAADTMLRSIARISLFHLTTEPESTLIDRYNLIEAMMAKRLAWVLNTACEKKSPTALEETVRLCGKLFLAFHNQHESLGYLLLLTLAETIQKSDIRAGDWDRDFEVTMTFSEIIKSLIDRSVERRISDHTSIKKILAYLEMYVRQSFHRDRSISPALLMQPFAEIGQLLAGERYRSIPDRDEILSDLRRLLAQFAALESVAGRLEEPHEGTDTSASYHEDLPFAPKKEEGD